MGKSPFKKLAKKADKLGKQIKEAKIMEKTIENIQKTTKPKVDENPLDQNKYEKSEIDIILHNIFTRQSIRHYLKKDVPDSFIAKLIDAARQAPSAGNYQPWEFVIVRDQTAKKHILDGCFRNIRRGSAIPGMEEKEEWILEAPVLIVATVNQRLAKGVYGERGDKLYGIQGVAAAIQNILLAAHAYGLGACWLGSFSEEHVSAVIACPKYMRPCAIVTIGWSAEKPKKPERHPLGEFIHIEKFGRTPREKLVRPRKQLF